MSDENPFVEEFVDEDEDGTESLMSCWKDGSRACSEECVAYEDRIEQDPRYNPCMLINLKRGFNASVALIAKELKRLADFYGGADDDLLRRAVTKFTDEEIKSMRAARERELKEDDRTRAQTEIAPPEIKK